MAQGDHIRVNRGFYWHHGIDCGDGTVIHLAGEPAQMASAVVERVPLNDFSLGGVVEIMMTPKAYAPDHVVARAESRVGTAGLPGFRAYDLVNNNCEHFAHWCCAGIGASQQVKIIGSFIGKAAAAFAAFVILRRMP